MASEDQNNSDPQDNTIVIREQKARVSYNLGEHFRGQGDFDMARKMYSDAMTYLSERSEENDTLYDECLNEYAKTCCYKQDFQEAIATWQKMIEWRRPSAFMIFGLLGRAMAWRILGNTERSKQEAKFAQQIGGSDISLLSDVVHNGVAQETAMHLQEKAFSLEAEGQLQQAADVFLMATRCWEEEWIADSEHDNVFYLCLLLKHATLMNKCEKWKESIAVLDNAIEFANRANSIAAKTLAFTRVEAYFERGTAWMKTGNSEKSKSDFNTVVCIGQTEKIDNELVQKAKSMLTAKCAR